MTTLFRTLFLLFLCTNLTAGEFRIVSIEFFPSAGMFASANLVLGQLYLYEKKELFFLSGMAVDFGTFGLYYDPEYGPNWWNYYFEPISIGVKENTIMSTIQRQDFVSGLIKRRRRLSRQEAADLVNKYIHPLPHIVRKVDQFAAHNFKDLFIIGVHYRGTDKKKEADRVSYEKVFKKIIDSIPKDRPFRIFVATDEEPFLESIKEKFPQQVIAASAQRTTGETGIHFSGNPGYALGEEALIDALLLSRCHLLIRTSSNLSLWSTYFNSDLPVILLNQRFLPSLEPE